MSDSIDAQTLNLATLNSQIVACRACPRLVEWRESIGAEKRRAFMDQEYWAKPIPNFGDPLATKLIVGLAPAAHGANRTGRMFTGDRSGDWLYRALYKAGVASQPHAESLDDGLVLHGVLITAAAHCAPPDNKPTPDEFRACRGYLEQTLHLRPWTSVLCLGSLAWNHFLGAASSIWPKPAKTHFSHGALLQIPGGPRVVGSYHPSQQNTFTGRLTETMLDQAIMLWLSES